MTERFALPGGTPCLLAEPPAQSGTDYGLVIGPDLHGLRLPAFQEMAQRLSSQEGWTVTVPEPFPGREDWDVWKRLDSMAEIDAAAQLRDIVAAADATGCTRVGMLGFCHGALHGYRAAATTRFEAVVAMYGRIRLLREWRTASGQDEPLEVLRRPRKCPVLAVIAGLDKLTPPDDVEELRAVLGVEVVVYEQADHAFVHDSSNETHRPGDAADAMERALRFLKAPPA